MGIEEKGRLIKYDILRNVNMSNEKVETFVLTMRGTITYENVGVGARNEASKHNK